MATTDCTLGTRFAGSKFSARNDILQFSGRALPSSEPGSQLHSDLHYNRSDSSFLASHQLDNTFAELMETLRVCMNDVLRLPFSVQKRSRLVRNYWEVELLVKEMRLLLEPASLTLLKQELLRKESLQKGVKQSP